MQNTQNKHLPWDIIRELESDNSRLFKESVITREARNNNDTFFAGVKLALDGFITFGIKKVPTATKSGDGLEWDEFTAVTDKLQKRELSGNAAIDAVDALCEKATIEQWNDWYRRILLKDLKCGVSVATVNNSVKKEYPQYTVTVFQVQLAHDSLKHESKMRGVKEINVKFDGVRVITIVHPNGQVFQYSRNGKELENFGKIKSVFESIAKHCTEPMVFDGEVVSSSFNSLMTQLYRKSDVQADDSILYLFDILTLSDFTKGFCPTKQSDRTQQLREFYNDAIAPINTDIVQLAEYITVDLSTSEGYAEFLKFNDQCIKNGLEGIIAKDVDAPYECKRVVHWLKLKPFIEVTLKVDAIEEGEGKYAGMMGALICSGEDSSLPDGCNIVTNVGSGFSDDLRAKIMQDRDAVIGQLVEIRADAISQNKDGGYSLRFPRFVRFRELDSGGKI